jgi:hypothetical protein
MRSATGSPSRSDPTPGAMLATIFGVSALRLAAHRLAQQPRLQMTERGATHLKVCCVVAGHLAERARTVLHRGTPYAICDNDGNPVTPQQARQIITEKWTVPEEVRKRRRSRKTAGKVPQAATTGPHTRGDLPRPRSSRSPHQAVKHARTSHR